MPSLRRIIRRANIVYSLEFFQSGIPHVPLYVSSGIVGGCFDHYGFMSRPNTGMPQGRTVLGYVNHYHRAEHGRHIQFPLAVLRARFVSGQELNLVDCRTYCQELDIYDAVLRTTYDLYGSTTVTAFVPQSAPSMLVMRLERYNPVPEYDLEVTIECETSECQNNDTPFTVEPVEVAFSCGAGEVRVRSRTNTTVTDWVIHCPTAQVRTQGTRVVLRMPSGAHELRIWVSHPQGAGHDVLACPVRTLLAQHTAAWHALWRTSWADLPEDRAQRIWCRMKYYALSTFPPTPERPPCPTGLLSNIWGFTFPQDVYYIEENLPRLGHTDRAAASLEWWLGQLDAVKAYGKRLLGVEGAYYPWTPPFKDMDGYETEGAVCADSYELHNPAYVAAMAWHLYLRCDDRALLERHFPVIREVFRFYASVLQKTAAGTYDIYHDKARGQDEASTTEGRLRNLLCAGYSAEYSARMLIQAVAVLGKTHDDLLGRARDIVACGISRQALLGPEGYYRTYEGDDRPPGSQKHPVQLNPIAYLPMPEMVERDGAVVCAWRKRYDLTIDARKPFTAGWTLGEFALASARMRAPKEMEKDLRAVQPCRGADPLWIQFYESSFWEGWHFPKAYYFPMMALYLQAFTDCLVQDWRGYVDLFACLLPGWERRRLAFAGIRAVGGVEVSGRWDRGDFRVTLTPHGAAAVRVRVSRPGVSVRAMGHQSGPEKFNGNKVVEFRFARQRAIRLSGVSPTGPCGQHIRTRPKRRA